MWPLLLLCAPLQDAPQPKLTLADLQVAARVIGLEFSDAEARQMLPDVEERLGELADLRLPASKLNGVSPALLFDPLVAGVTLNVRMPLEPSEREPWPEVERPAHPMDLLSMDLRDLTELVRTKQVTSVELTELALERLGQVDAHLHCVISTTRGRALEQARAMDAELERGRWRGFLHGIPYGVKDLFAAKGAPTTWGAKAYEDQVIDEDSLVVQRLQAAGAVLIAKTSVGALAWGDVWYGGTTRNPWNVDEGSSGSSAGSAAGVAAGALPFAIGTETLGSIISPCVRCGVTGLRPTFGRVPRTGGMVLSWSMDKVGPICRSADDAALILEVLAGPDGQDPSSLDRPLVRPYDLGRVRARLGYPKGTFTKGSPMHGVLKELEDLGHELVEVEIPTGPIGGMLLTLSAEASASFDAFTREGLDDLLVVQKRQAWPNLFRHARLIPAVEYINGQRARTQLCQAMDAVMGEVDLIVHPTFAAGILSITNLTGHPTLVTSFATEATGKPDSICFTGRLYDEGTLLNVVRAWQDVTGHRRKPRLDWLDSEPAEASEEDR
jgi:Asp-tRNA(Asn)/Glu-tRNA(Gln) amidotransferase A subunit family amidase